MKQRFFFIGFLVYPGCLHGGRDFLFKDNSFDHGGN